MFFNFFLRSFRILLFPISIVYSLVSLLRNFLFDKKVLKSVSFNLPIICVGNLAVGGTGKSPMIELLVSLLSPYFRVAILSRGYKRKTKGYILAGKETTAIEIGDEPMQFHRKFPEVPVAVGEERVIAVPQLLFDHPDTQAILLDDAFQHRRINAGLNILLTEHANLFYRDFLLPTGDLRDNRSSYRRAHIIVVTKCPADLTQEEARLLYKEINPASHQKVYFTTIDYGALYHILDHHSATLKADMEVLLVTGIANPEPLKKLLLQRVESFEQIIFSDHHIFNIDDWNDIRKRFSEMNTEKKMILTTEKDAVRLFKFSKEMKDMPVYVIPIQHKFLFGQEPEFLSAITGFIHQFNPAING